MAQSDIMALAGLISQSAQGTGNLHAGSWIRTIHRLPDGAEALRLIVRDDILGAGQAVADALWVGL